MSKLHFDISLGNFLHQHELVFHSMTCIKLPEKNAISVTLANILHRVGYGEEKVLLYLPHNLSSADHARILPRILILLFKKKGGGGGNCGDGCTAL